MNNDFYSFPQVLKLPTSHNRNYECLVIIYKIKTTSKDQNLTLKCFYNSDL